MNIALKTSEIIYREDLYPRIKPTPSKIQEYSENIELLPPVEIDQHNILIDGYHRWKAHETAKIDIIQCTVTEVKSEFELERLAVRRNAGHGQQLSQSEKKKKAIRWWDRIPDTEIIKELSISMVTYNRWTKNKRDERAKQIKEEIQYMWMACYTQQEIADKIGIEQQTVSNKIVDFTKSDHVSEKSIFSNFKPELYTIWNFQKLTNQTKISGSIPQEIIDNLLYYYTKPFDIVFDPFGGGGATIDVCLKRMRRFYVSDLSPIPARNDIRQWDIIEGLPDNLPVPDFVFLDPPYWKQAEKKYSEKDTDLANISLDDFIKHIGNIAKSIKRKWNNRPDARLAIIIGPFYRAGKYTDLSLLCNNAISKYLTLTERIQVPYTTQIATGDDVNKAKNDKRMIHRIRDLLVYKHNEKLL